MAAAKGPPGGPSAEELAKSMESVKASSAEAEKHFRGQLDAVMQMQAAMSDIVKSMQALCAQDCAGMSPQKWDEVSAAVEKTEKSTKGATTAVNEMATAMKSNFSKAVVIGSGALNGFVQGLKNLAALTKGTLNLISSLIGGFFAVGKAIISMPLKMLEGLFGMASQQGGTELQTAIENVRKEFGDLSSQSAKTVLDVAKGLGSLDSTGVSAFQIWGALPAKIETVLALAKSLGAQFQIFQGEIAANGEAIMRYQKGLGLTDEMMSSIASNAVRMGTAISDIQNDMTKQALGMSKAFGVNAKVISRDMGKAMQDLAHFGHLSTKEMAVAATFANKLGVSVDKLTGIMDATKTFDQSAESMSKLNEQFGTNIDATEMMMAQNPAQKVEMLRKEFARTGKDMSKLSVQERDLIKQNTGLSDEMLNAAFSAKNAGVSLDKISKQGDRNSAKTMTQTEAMEKLASSIERMVVAGESSTGFFDALKKGFMRGLQNTPEFIGLMTNLKNIINQTTMFGVRLGKMFATSFPGIQKFITGLKEMFDPKRFTAFYADIENTFKKFKSGSIGSFGDLMTELKKKFWNFFDSGSPAGKKVLDGMKEFLQGALKIFGQLTKWVIEELAKMIPAITEWIKNPKLPTVSADSTGWAKAAQPLIEAFTSLKDKLLPVLKDLASAVWEKLSKSLADSGITMRRVLMGALAVVFLPAITGAIGSALTSKVLGKSVEGAAGKIGGMLSAAKGGAAGSAAAPDVSKSPAAMASSAIPDKKTIKQMEIASRSKVDWTGLTAFILGIAGLFTIGMVAFKEALKIVKDVDLADIGRASLLFGAVATFMIPMAKAGEILSNSKSLDLETAGIVLAGIAGMMMIGIGGFSLGILAVKKLKVSMKDIKLAEVFMLAMIPPIAAAGLLVAEAKFVGELITESQDKVVEGMIAMGAVLAAMVIAAAAIGGLTKWIGANEMNAGAAMLDVVANAFMKTGIIIGEAAVIGAVILGTAGVGAAAIGAGMGAMAAAVVIMGETAGEIIKQIVQIPGDPVTLKTKTEAFTMVLNSIISMMSEIGGILRAADLKSMAPQDRIEMLKKIGQFVQEILNGTDGKGGVNGIIEKVISGIKEIPQEKIETAKAFAGVLSAVSGMISAVGKSTGELQSNATHWYRNSAQNRKSVESALVDGALYIDSIMSSSGVLIKKITSSLKEVKDGAAFSQAAGAIGGILQAVSGLMGAIMPNISSFRKETEASVKPLGFWGPGAGAKHAQVDTEAIKGVEGYITSVMTNLSNVLPNLVGGVMSGISSELKKLDEKQLQSLPAVGEIIKSLAGIISSISANVKGVGNVNISAAQGATVNIINQIPSISQIISDIGKSAPGLMKNFIALADLIPKDPSFKSKVETLSFIFDSINKIIQAVNSAIDGSKVTQVPGAGTVNSILTSLAEVANLLWGFRYNWVEGHKGEESVKLIVKHLSALSNLVAKDPQFGEKSKLIVDMFENVNKIISAINTPLSKPGSKDGTLKSIGSVVEILDELTAEIPDIQGSAENLFKSLGDTKTFKATFDSNLKGIDANIAAVKDMISKTRELDDALSNMPKFAFPAKLEAIAKGMGVGGRFAYTVQSKEVVLNVEFNVVMTGEDIEKAVITRTKSVLRDRINFLLESVPNLKKSAAEIGIKKSGDQERQLAATVQP